MAKETGTVFVFSVRLEFDGPVDTDRQSQDVHYITERIRSALMDADAVGELAISAELVSLEVDLLGVVPAAVPDETYTPEESEDDNG